MHCEWGSVKQTYGLRIVAQFTITIVATMDKHYHKSSFLDRAGYMVTLARLHGRPSPFAQKAWLAQTKCTEGLATPVHFHSTNKHMVYG